MELIKEFNFLEIIEVYLNLGIGRHCSQEEKFMSFLYSHVLTLVKTGNMVSGGVTFFKYFQGYLGIFRDTDAYSVTLTGTQLGRGEWGRPSLPFFEKPKSALIISTLGLDFPFII